MHPKKRQIEHIKSAKRENLAKILGAYEEYYRLSFVKEEKEAFEEIEDKLNSSALVCFIRGNAQDPQCRASRLMIENLDRLEVKYKSFDIMMNNKMKEWLKYYANWPGYPQLYIYGKFIGGTEILLQLIDDDEFMQMVPNTCIKTNPIERINKALARSVIVIFIKGSRKRPFDGY